MTRFLYLIPLLCFVAIVVHFSVPILEKKDPRILPSAMIQKSAPNKILTPLLSSIPGIDPQSLRGDVRMVNFFSSWCGPCRAEHPLLMKLAQEKAIPIYGINYKDKRTAAKNWLNELGNPFERIGQDQTGRIAVEWGVYGVPETYIIDRDGIIQFRHVGPISSKVFEAEFLPIISTLRKQKQ